MIQRKAGMNIRTSLTAATRTETGRGVDLYPLA